MDIIPYASRIGLLFNHNSLGIAKAPTILQATGQNLIVAGAITDFDKGLGPEDLKLAERIEILDSDEIIGLMAETNATGFDVTDYKYDVKSGLFDVTLEGEQREDTPYCGGTINAKVRRGEDGIEVVEAEIDRSYYQMDDIDM